MGRVKWMGLNLLFYLSLAFICEPNIFFYISSIICILSPIVKAVAVELGFKEDLVASLPFTLLHLLETTDFQHS